LLSYADLDAELCTLLDATVWYVGFSGGIDSSVLLHLLHQWCAAHPGAPPLHAIHINHALQPAAAHWQLHCESVCAGLALPLSCTSVEVRATGSAEVAAREARYGAFEAQLPPRGVLFMGHHLDDQVETFFLRLMRGAGVEGLAAIPHRRRLGEGVLVRPLLDVPRTEIAHYAAHHRLAFVDDPSNNNTAMDRNFLRAQVLPLLASRWPGYRQTVGRAGRHMAAAAALMADVVGVPQTVNSAMGDTGFSLASLLAGTEEVAAAGLRMWLRASGLQAPEAAQLAEFLRQLRVSAVDAGPRLACGSYSLQRYREAVYIVPVWDAPAPSGALSLTVGSVLRVPGVGVLSLQSAQENGLYLRPGESLGLLWRRGGERCRLPGRSGSRLLKTLWQEWHVPPWWRERVPLLYLGEELLAVGDVACCESSRWREQAQAGEQLWTLRWERDPRAVFD
jgi:tRNA(Ile)-lysidine synthase